MTHAFTTVPCTGNTVQYQHSTLLYDTSGKHQPGTCQNEQRSVFCILHFVNLTQGLALAPSRVIVDCSDY